MPERPKHPCGATPCAALAEGGARFCVAHKGREDAYRGSANDRGYDSRWQEFRKWFLAKHPLCGARPADAYNVGTFVILSGAKDLRGALTDSLCRRDGRITAATVVDHIFEHAGRTEHFWDFRNHQALCAECHNRKPPRPWK